MDILQTAAHSVEKGCDTQAGRPFNGMNSLFLLIEDGEKYEKTHPQIH